MPAYDPRGRCTVQDDPSPCLCAAYALISNQQLTGRPTHPHELCLCTHPYYRHEITPSEESGFQKGANPAHGCGGWIQSAPSVTEPHRDTCEGCMRPWIEHQNIIGQPSSGRATLVHHSQRHPPAPPAISVGNATRPIEEWVSPPPPPLPAQAGRSTSRPSTQRGPPARQSTAFSNAAVTATQRTRTVSTKKLPHNQIKKGSYMLPADATGQGKPPPSTTSKPGNTGNSGIHQYLVLINPFSVTSSYVGRRHEIPAHLNPSRITYTQSEVSLIIDAFGTMGLSFMFTLIDDQDQHDDFYIAINNHFYAHQLVVPYDGIPSDQYGLLPFGEDYIEPSSTGMLPSFSTMPLAFLRASGTQVQDGSYRFQKQEPYRGLLTHSKLKKLPKLHHPEDPSITLMFMCANVQHLEGMWRGRIHACFPWRACAWMRFLEEHKLEGDDECFLDLCPSDDNDKSESDSSEAHEHHAEIGVSTPQENVPSLVPTRHAASSESLPEERPRQCPRTQDVLDVINSIDFSDSSDSDEELFLRPLNRQRDDSPMSDIFVSHTAQHGASAAPGRLTTQGSGSRASQRRPLSTIPAGPSAVVRSAGVSTFTQIQNRQPFPGTVPYSASTAHEIQEWQASVRYRLRELVQSVGVSTSSRDLSNAAQALLEVLQFLAEGQSRPFSQTPGLSTDFTPAPSQITLPMFLQSYFTVQMTSPDAPTATGGGVLRSFLNESMSQIVSSSMRWKPNISGRFSDAWKVIFGK
ncbi:hypothetical protein BKA70DRAFT_1432323 [Coprinopsis sp. MPI-PUGE-AT-0042]|nr:hypothetical protein BKA70DRAFT_1432323 [Coprinopsis sp. MPI-PUGE-AT-0042]